MQSFPPTLWFIIALLNIFLGQERKKFLILPPIKVYNFNGTNCLAYLKKVSTYLKHTVS